MGRATARANPSVFEIAHDFGSTSANTTKSAVITSVAHTTPPSPNRRRNSAVARAEDRMFTRLFPISSAPISRSRRSISVSTSAARVSPACAAALSRARETAVSAVSEPEKKADMPMSTATARAVRTISMSNPMRGT